MTMERRWTIPPYDQGDHMYHDYDTAPVDDSTLSRRWTIPPYAQGDHNTEAYATTPVDDSTLASLLS